MDQRKQSKSEKRFVSPLDIFAVLFLVLCIAAAILRLTLNLGGEGSSGQLAEYIISYKVESIVTTSSGYFERGTEFYIVDGGEVFGVTQGEITITPAQYYSEDEMGHLTLKYYPEKGDESLVDIKGSMKVMGTRDPETGIFKLNGTTILTPNRELTLRSSEMEVTITLTEISKS